MPLDGFRESLRVITTEELHPVTAIGAVGMVDAHQVTDVVLALFAPLTLAVEVLLPHSLFLALDQFLAPIRWVQSWISLATMLPSCANHSVV